MSSQKARVEVESASLQRVKKTLSRFRDWNLFRYEMSTSIFYDEYEVELEYEKWIRYPGKGRWTGDTVFAKVAFDIRREEIYVRVWIYTLGGYGSYNTLEEYDYTVKRDEATTLYILRLVRRYLNNTIKALRE